MKLLLMAASLRKGSLNKKVIRNVVRLATKEGHDVNELSFNDFDLPLYNADLNEEIGVPPAAQTFISLMDEHDALILSSPEYNFSTPGTLKNFIDWVSRGTPSPWEGRQILLLSASPALAGGNRGLLATRVPLECCGAFVFPKMFSLPDAGHAFNDDDTLKDPSHLLKMLRAFTDHLKC